MIIHIDIVIVMLIFILIFDIHMCCF